MVDLAAGPVKARIASTDAHDFARSPSCREHLVPFLRWLLRRHLKFGGVTEVRAIAEQPAKMVWSGFFDAGHRQDLVELILPGPGGPRAKVPFGDTPRVGEANFYFTMQPVNPDLLARCAYRLGRCQATSDQDVVCYALFAVDVDPVHPSGISATDAEKDEARKVANAVGRWLKEHGIHCIPADSGNGYHLLVPTILYPDVKAASEDARTLLHLLDGKFSTDKAKVDTTIYNPGRILKLYGTRSVKGSDLPERPHRFATVKLAHVPDDVDLFGVLRKQLDAYRKASGAAKPAAPADAARRASPTTGSRDGWDAETSNKVLRGVLERSGLPFRVKVKGGDHFYEFKDCPSHTDPDGHTYECCAIVRGDGSFAAKCMHDDQASWREHFKPMVGWDAHVGGVLDGLGIPRGTGPYQATPGGIVHRKPSRDGTVNVPLTNFTATITKDVGEDDGVESRRVFEVEAQLRGRTFRFTVPAQDFAAMAWPVEHLGAQAVVYAGHGSKDHARAAVQILSGEIPTVRVYTHLGWRKHGGGWVYLHAGGAIGPAGLVKGVSVRLAEPFGRFLLPELGTKQELQKAVRASLKLLDLAPDEVTMPVFCAVWRAAAGGTDFSLHMAGPSGVGKSELAALAQQFWGKGLDARHLPANWASTANANEALAFLAKDTLLVVDDFAPRGTQYDVQKKHQEADRLLRGQGNNSGRNRMRADTSLRPPKPPRGLILSTGEDVPRGQSLQARLLVEEISPGALDWKRLTYRQRDARKGLYARAMSGFVRWLARKYEWVREELMPDLLPRFRELATTCEQHKRTPNLVADLYLGLDLFTRYATACGALSEEEGDALLTRGWLALGQAAEKQREIQTSSEPAQRYLELLNAALASGKAHVADSKGDRPKRPEAWGWRRQGEGWQPCGGRVGWLDAGHLFLEPEAAFRVVQEMGQAGGEPLPIGSKTLHKRLDANKMLASKDAKRDRLLVRRTLEGKQRSVLHLRANALIPAGLAEK